MIFRNKRRAVGVLVLLFVLVAMAEIGLCQTGSEGTETAPAKPKAVSAKKAAPVKGKAATTETKKDASEDTEKASDENGQKKQEMAPGNLLFTLMIYIVPMFLFLYFVFIRPEKKKDQARRDMLGTLKKNDEVLTYGGIYGTVVKLTERELTLCVDKKNDVQMKFTRSAVAEIINSRDKDVDSQNN